MPSHLKELVRARMQKTGESHQQALRHVRGQEHAPQVDAVSTERGPEHAARSRTVADTAFSIAVVRAEESLRPPGERLFDDPLARLFTPESAEASEATQRFLDLAFFRDGVRLRTRFIDDALRDGLAAGLDQIVLLGAGFDTRALRMPEIRRRRARTYEVDTPEQLARKRTTLVAAGEKIPPSVVGVPFDLGAEDLEASLSAALAAKGFRCGAGAFFVWEGVIGYIDDAAIDRSLRFMVSAGGPRTRVAFTFADEAFLGEEPMSARTKRAGFASFEGTAGDALWRRYLPGHPPSTAWVMKVGLAAV